MRIPWQNLVESHFAIHLHFREEISQMRYMQHWLQKKRWSANKNSSLTKLVLEKGIYYILILNIPNVCWLYEGFEKSYSKEIYLTLFNPVLLSIFDEKFFFLTRYNVFHSRKCWCRELQVRMDENGITVVTQEKNNQVEDEPKIDAGMQKISWLGMEMLLCQMTSYILEIGWIFSNILSRSSLSHSHKWWILLVPNISKACVSDHLPFFKFVIHSTPGGRTRENRLSFTFQS